MAYQGISPYLYRNNLTNVQLLDDISGSFNGTTTQFNLTTNGSQFHAVSARSLVIVLGGIIQEPDADYTVNAGVITFTTAPVSGLTFSARNIYGLNRLTGINDGLVTPASLSVGGPSWDTSGNTTITGNITQTGSTNNLIINTDTPTVRPTLDLNFERDQRLDSRITFSRDSIATYLGSDGLIKTALADQPRFEFDTSGNCLGLLIEESRTNLITNSNSPTSATGGTRTDNSQVAPDGTTTAGQLVSDSSTGYHAVVYSLSSLPSGNKFAWSIFVKLGTSNYTKVVLYDNAQTSPGAGSSRFDLSTGTKENGTGKIVAYPNGWYRLTIYGERTFTPTSCSLHLFFYNGTTVSFTGDGTSTFYYWGAQLEDNVEFETSYIPTSGSTVTRAADDASITGTNFTDWYNASEGTIFAESSFADLTTANQPTVRFSGVSSPEQIGMGYRWGGSGSGTYGFYIQNTNDQLFRAPSGVTANTFVKASLAYKSNDGASSLNGETAVSDDSVIVPTVNKFQIGRGYSIYNMQRGHIKSVKYYPKRLPNNQLQNLTK